MSSIESVQKEKLEKAFEQIRKDVAYLQRDLAYAEQNRSRWIFIIMWIVLADLIKNFFDLSILYSFGVSGIIVGLYRLVDGYRITKRALRSLKEPLEPLWDTKIDLS